MKPAEVFEGVEQLRAMARRSGWEHATLADLAWLLLVQKLALVERRLAGIEDRLTKIVEGR